MKEGRQIARSAGKVGLFTLASRVLGLLRDSVVAALFPKSATDVFFVAFTIPNVLRQLLAEGALTAAFIPVFTEYRENRGDEETRAMLRNMLGAAFTVLALVTLAGILGAPWVVRLFAFGFSDSPEKLGLAVALTRLMFVFLVAVGLTALAMGVLNVHRHFSAPAAAPVVLNMGIIATVYAGLPLMPRLGLPPITALAIGVVIGGFAQVVLQLPFLSRHRMLVLPRFRFTDPGVVRVGKLMLPAVFGLAIYQVNIILSRQFASFLSEGSISALYYSQRLIEFPMGIFAVAIATVAMPNLSSHANAGDLEGLKATYRYALGLVLFIILPASAGLLALAEPLTTVLFQRGKFTHELALHTALTLQGFLAGLWAGASVRQTVPVFYALQDTRTPVKVACLTVVVYAAMAWTLYRRLGTLGLALAVSASSATNFLALLYLLRRRLGRMGLRSLAGSVVKSAVASLVAGAAAWGVGRLGHWERGGGAPGNYVVLVLGVVAGIVVYVALCRLLRCPELHELWRAFGRARRGRGGGAPPSPPNTPEPPDAGAPKTPAPPDSPDPDPQGSERTDDDDQPR
jgi:putative peptidoglycan lipid II flippase